MIVLLNTRPDEVIAVNLDNVTSIEFRPDGASIWFNLYDPDSSMPDGFRVVGDAARDLFRVVSQNETRPAYSKPYPGEVNDRGRQDDPGR
jgi:hypothetical protein